MPTQPYFTKDTNPELFTRSAVKYTSVNVKEILDRNPSDVVLSLIELAQELHTGAFICGGAAQSLFSNRPVNDIDIYFNGEEAFEDTLAKFEEHRTYSKQVQPHLIHLTPTNRGMIPVQLMNLAWFGDARHTIDVFDFTVCQFALHGDTVWYNPISLMDLMKKQIRVHRFLPQAKPLQRLAKYSKKGFWAPPETIEAIENYIRNPPVARQPIPYNPPVATSQSPSFISGSITWPYTPPTMMGLNETIRCSEETATLRSQEVAWSPGGSILATQGPLPEGTHVHNNGLEPYLVDRQAANPCDGTPTLWLPQTTSDQQMAEVWNLNRGLVTVRRFETAALERTATIANTTATDDSEQLPEVSPRCFRAPCAFDYNHTGLCSDGATPPNVRPTLELPSHLQGFDRPPEPLIVSPRVFAALRNAPIAPSTTNTTYPVPDRPLTQTTAGIVQSINAALFADNSTFSSPLQIEPLSPIVRRTTYEIPEDGINFTRLLSALDLGLDNSHND
jgi:hypothetical protein